MAGARPQVVAVGGGHGLSRTLAALGQLEVDATAIVTVADDGGSSGRLRRELGVLPPGDLRRALSATTPDAALAELLEYRFGSGPLAGHAVGNLLLVALQDLRGDLGSAVEALAGLVGARARILPCTNASVHLVAEGALGTVRGQVAVATTSGHRAVRLDPPAPPANPDAVAAIQDADLVVLGPGSLFTSILPNLLVPGIARAVTESAATLAYVANMREQPGETEGMSQEDHLDVLGAQLPGRPLDVVICHDGAPPAGPGKVLGVPMSHAAARRIQGLDLLDGDDGHDASLLAEALRALLPT